MSDDRLQNVLEQCRERLHPELSESLVRAIADVQVHYQFKNPDSRKEPLRDVQDLIDEEMQRLGHGGASR